LRLHTSKNKIKLVNEVYSIRELRKSTVLVKQKMFEGLLKSRIYLHKGPFSGNAASLRLDSKLLRQAESKADVETFEEKGLQMINMIVRSK
jgi:hypothetical protein